MELKRLKFEPIVLVMDETIITVGCDGKTGIFVDLLTNGGTTSKEKAKLLQDLEYALDLALDSAKIDIG